MKTPREIIITLQIGNVKVKSQINEHTYKEVKRKLGDDPLIWVIDGLWQRIHEDSEDLKLNPIKR